MRGIMISCVSLVVQMLTLAVFITKIRTNRQRLGKLKDLHEVTSQMLREVNTKAAMMGNKHRMSDALDNLSHDEGADTNDELPKPEGTLTLISTMFNWSNENASLGDRRLSAVTNISGTSDSPVCTDRP
ncbi:uncharacterized protein [Littorina saxatilis]|uniref:uncharacterized protein n=1 Tax=Littorina saxatilis TaxID=31220 RepID=UPI0038B4AC47